MAMQVLESSNVWLILSKSYNFQIFIKRIFSFFVKSTSSGMKTCKVELRFCTPELDSFLNGVGQGLTM
jgi:hypothetical protein